jgi:hypothetical protein
MLYILLHKYLIGNLDCYKNLIRAQHDDKYPGKTYCFSFLRTHQIIYPDIYMYVHIYLHL